MNTEFRNDLCALFDEEINAAQFRRGGATYLLYLLLAYKVKFDIPSFIIHDHPLSFCAEGTPPEYNAIIIGGDVIGEEYYDELISGFVNSNIQDQDPEDEFRIYQDKEHAIVQITKGGRANASNIYGYVTEQMFMAIITKLLPWFFDDIEPAKMDEIRLIACDLIKPEGRQRIEDLFEEVMRNNGYVIKLQHEQLMQLGAKIIANRSENLRHELRDKQEAYERWFADLTECNRRIMEIKRRITAIENSAEDVENPICEITEFLESTTMDFALDEISGTRIYISYRLPMTVYDTPEEYESMIKESSGNSYFFEMFKHNHSVADIKAAYKRIIEDRDCTVWVSGKIWFDIEDMTFRADNTSVRPHSGMHPHLNGSLSCFGSAEGVLRSYLMETRLGEFMNQMSYSAQQFTMSDSYAAEYYLNGIRDFQCIECPDGVYRNFDELIAAINEGEI